MSQPPEIIQASSVERWNDSADVVIVGLGIAGACAALEARRAGADVLVAGSASFKGGPDHYAANIAALRQAG